MELLAVLSPAGVRRTVIYAAGRRGVLGGSRNAGGLTTEVADGALARLAGASLLTFSIGDSAVTVHRLVMRVVREHAASRSALAVICASAAGLLEELVESQYEIWHEDRDATRDLVEQIMALYSVSAAYPGEDDLTRALFRLRWWAAGFLTYLGDSTAQSIRIAEPLLADQERVLGVDHYDTLATRNHLALGYYNAGRTAEATALHEKNLRDYQRVLGADHPHTLAVRGNLGLAYRAAGRAAEAIALHEKNLPDSERVLGGDHDDTLIARGYLASAYQAAGRTAEAIALHEKNLPDCERVLGADHPYTLEARRDLAVAYQAAGRTAEAVTLLEQALAECERVLGGDHPGTLQTRKGLAIAYQAASRTAESADPGPQAANQAPESLRHYAAPAQRARSQRSSLPSSTGNNRHLPASASARTAALSAGRVLVISQLKRAERVVRCVYRRQIPRSIPVEGGGRPGN